jgi:uncharacterized protein (DUF2235 family)
MDEKIKQAFADLRTARDTIESIRAELPQLVEAEKREEAAKKILQDYAKLTGDEPAADGYEVKLSVRGSWDGKALDGYAVAHPEVLTMKNESTVATVRKAK